MEHALTTPVAGTVDLLVAAGDQVKVDQLLARIIPAYQRYRRRRAEAN